MTTDTQLVPTDAELLGLNVGEVYFSESPSKYPEVHGTQYHAGAPGVLAFARAVLARWGQPAHSGEGEVDRADAVNLARNCLGAYNCVITKKGMSVLAEAVLSMDAALSTPQPTQTVPPAGLAPEFDQFLSDVMTAAGLVTHGKQCKQLGERLGAAVMKLRAHGIKKGGQHGAE